MLPSLTSKNAVQAIKSIYFIWNFLKKSWYENCLLFLKKNSWFLVLFSFRATHQQKKHKKKHKKRKKKAKKSLLFLKKSGIILL